VLRIVTVLALSCFNMSKEPLLRHVDVDGPLLLSLGVEYRCAGTVFFSINDKGHKSHLHAGKNHTIHIHNA